MSYRWEDNSTNAVRTVTTAGTYSVTVIAANGCTATASVGITGNATAAQASVAASTTVLSCASPSASLTASGGVSYRWEDNSTNPVRTVTTAGTYSVTVTAANGCTATASVSITGNATAAQASIAASTTALSCATPVVSLTASGGVSYRWEDNSTSATRTVSTSGTYSVTVTAANGCTATASVTVSDDKTTPTAEIMASATTVSAGQSITLTASGGITYQWSTGATAATIVQTPPIGSTVYSVTVTNASGCSATASVSITVTGTRSVVGPASLCVKTVPPDRDEVTLPITMTVSGAPAAYVYSWSYKAPKSTNYKDIAAKGTSIGKVDFKPVTGTPTLRIVGAKGNLNGLQGYLVRLTVTLGTEVIGSAETLLDGNCELGNSNTRQGVFTAEAVQVLVYPNPVVEVLQVEIKGLSQPAKVGLFDLQGRQRGQWSVEPVEGVGQLKAAVTDFSGGLYLLQVETANGVLHRQRVLMHR
ncbi:hypothetical protein GCM10023189_08760 [Nibrella saemangeumensis]|uniref:PKD/Chitinase domain-containing protein n=1 Tax=Nibrella saemangeumensis TaxID=1084526 RepID=A0ABP8MI97_9BACT